MKDEQTLPDRDLADALIRRGRHAEAVPLYRKLTETFPEEESHLLSLAWALHDSGRPQEAAGCFERLFAKELARRLFAGFAYDELVRIYREGRNWEALISVCARASAAQPEDVGLLKTLGDAYLLAERFADGLHVCETLIDLEPEDPEHWSALGAARLAIGNIEEAEAAYKRAAEIAPADAPLFFSRLAGGFLRAECPENAQVAIERCLKLKPDDPLYLMGFGDILICRGKPGEAAEAYARAAFLTPTSAGACWYRLGETLARKGLQTQATEAFVKAAAAEPKNPRYLLRLAASYDARGLIDLARETLLRVDELTRIN
jgi:tetratricopeptide (TPR) repeat protein